MLDHSDKKDAERYRKLLDLQTGRAAKLIEEVGSIGLDNALDALNLDGKNLFSLRNWQKQTQPKGNQ